MFLAGGDNNWTICLNPERKLPCLGGQQLLSCTTTSGQSPLHRYTRKKEAPSILKYFVFLSFYYWRVDTILTNLSLKSCYLIPSPQVEQTAFRSSKAPRTLSLLDFAHVVFSFQHLFPLFLLLLLKTLVYPLGLNGITLPLASPQGLSSCIPVYDLDSCHALPRHLHFTRHGRAPPWFQSLVQLSPVLGSGLHEHRNPLLSLLVPLTALHDVWHIIGPPYIFVASNSIQTQQDQNQLSDHLSWAPGHFLDCDLCLS